VVGALHDVLHGHDLPWDAEVALALSLFLLAFLQK
jgi:hypothetical protein